MASDRPGAADDRHTGPPVGDRDAARTDGGAAGTDGDAAEKIRRLSAQLAAARRALAERDDRLQALTDQVADLTSLHGSTALAAATAARRAARRALPPGTRRGRAAVTALGMAHGAVRGRTQPVTTGGEESTTTAWTGKSEATRYAAEPAVLAAEYRRWLAAHEPGPDELGVLRRANVFWSHRPLVSVVLSGTGTGSDLEAEWIAESIDSVVAQIYGNWELSMATAPSRPDAARVLECYRASDSRIRPAPEDQGGTSTGAREGAVPAGGEWFVHLDVGDLLRPDALHRIVAHLTEHDDVDVVYADEDRLSRWGDRERPQFKPDWSPDYLLSKDYLGCPTAIRRSLLEDGGWPVTCGPEGEHDLHLRATERARGVGHVPSVLATRRQRGPVAAGGGPGEDDNPVARALVRRRQAGRAVPRVDGGDDLRYDIRYRIEAQPSVDIIIPTRDRVDLLAACIDSITERSTYPAYRIVVVDNDSVEDETLRYFQREDLQVVPAPGPFNFSRLVNTGARASDADYVLLLNNDVTVVTADWIEAMLEVGQQPDVGAVGCRLLFPDGSVQHEGVALLPEYTAANVSWPWPVIRNTSAVTAACMLVRRDVYWSIGGFDEEMGVVYNDVDFCLRLLRSGRRVLYTPYAQLVHDESSSRGGANPQADVDLFFDRWGTPDQLRDPFVSPHVLWPHPQRLRFGRRDPALLGEGPGPERSRSRSLLRPPGGLDGRA